MRQAIYVAFLIFNIFQFVLTLKKQDKDAADKFILVGSALAAVAAVALIVSDLVIKR